MVTTSAPDDDYSASELSLVIDKADSIEEKDEISETVKETTRSTRHRKTCSCDDIVIEEEAQASSDSDVSRERKISIVAIESKKSFEADDSQLKQQSRPIEALQLPPTSTSTQTVPTDEFPEVAVETTTINQTDVVREIAQLNVETQEDTKIAQEIDKEVKEIRKSCSRSTSERDESYSGDAVVDETAKSCFKSSDDQQQKQEQLSYEQSMSQDEDFEVAMVSGLLPGCVAPAPTPAPSIAPLAEIEVDPTEDEPENAGEQGESAEPKPEVERKKKRKERKDKEGGESQSQAQGETDSSTDPEKSKRNAVCPWEDE